jgi:hypothetical protein
MRSWEFSAFPWVSPPSVLIEVDGVRRPKPKAKRAGPKPDYSIYNHPSPVVKKPTAEPVEREAEAVEALTEVQTASEAVPEPKKTRAPSVLLPISDLGAISGEKIKPRKTPEPLVPALPDISRGKPLEDGPKAEESAQSIGPIQAKAEETKEEEAKPTFDDEGDIEVINKYLRSLHEDQLREYRRILKEILNDAKKIEKILRITR